MIPVSQRHVNDTNGDCLAACFASILEMPIEDVPPLLAGSQFPHWIFAVRAWLSPANLSLVCIKDVDVPDGWSICTVKSKRFPGKYHAVVAKDGEPMHDPSPTADLEWDRQNICWFHAITVIDPTRPVNVEAIAGKEGP